MKRLLLIVIVIFSLLGCDTQTPPQQSDPVQSGLAAAMPKADKKDESERMRLRPVESHSAEDEGCVEVEVNYDLTLAEIAIEYDWTAPFLYSKDFRAKPRNAGTITKEVCWFKIGEYGIPSKRIIERIEASGKFLVADLWELNSLGTAKPDLQRAFTIAALGSAWRDLDGNLGNFVCPILREIGRRRLLSFREVQDRWDEEYRFLAVRK